MAEIIIDGKALAKSLQSSVAAQVAALSRRPALIALAVGHDEASIAYTNSQAKLAAKLGIDYRLEQMPSDSSEGAVAERLEGLSRDDAVTGIMLQTPLPRGLSVARLRARIAVEKDVEAVTESAAGRLLANTHAVAPCTAMAAFHCLRSVLPDPSGADVVVLGRSDVVGKPLSLLLLHANATVTLCHTKTRDVAAHTRRADVVIVCAGRPGLLRGDMIRPGAIVIDVGTNHVDGPDGGRLTGDVAFDEVAPLARAITPVPGGVGPVTVAMLMQNVAALATSRR